ncbi:hypothetical protein ABF87_10855, partial [Nitrosomonas sp. JL21]|nr:hypothetical protein [Nitrosomonas sp. JL21]
YEVEHILTCATLSASAALERKESRWGNAHQRTDFPDKDDDNWLCHLILNKGEDNRDIQISKKAVKGFDAAEVKK